MSQHRVAWLAWSLAALSVLAGATGVALFAHAQHAPQHPGDDTLSIALQCVDMVVFACVGALIASRRPRNPVGWLVCMAGLLGTIGPQGFGFGYAHDSLARPTDMLPATNWAVWLTGGLNTASISLAMVAFQLFPTGRRASDGWRPVLWLTAGLGALATLAEAIRPGPFETFPSIQNPLGIGGGLANWCWPFRQDSSTNPARCCCSSPRRRCWSDCGARRHSSASKSSGSSTRGPSYPCISRR